jgi:hypothetical protein
MSPTDAALDDLHEEQKRRNRTLRQMVDGLHKLGYPEPMISERIKVYRSIPVPREDYSYLDYSAFKQFNEERDNG